MEISSIARTRLPWRFLSFLGITKDKAIRVARLNSKLIARLTKTKKNEMKILDNKATVHKNLIKITALGYPVAQKHFIVENFLYNFHYRFGA